MSKKMLGILHGFAALASMGEVYNNKSSYTTGEKQVEDMPESERVLHFVKTLRLTPEQKAFIADPYTCAIDLYDTHNINIKIHYFYELKRYFQECGYYKEESQND